MREIKFRAWSEYYKYMQYNIQSAKPSFGEWDCFSYYLTNEIYVVMQYTGLKDKNGKEIYEGDVVKYEITHPLLDTVSKYRNSVVEFRNGSFVYSESLRDLNNVEIIGNICENPELRKENE